jgi:hypothetical protein
MSVTYDIGTLAAELQLTAISARHGGVIHHNLAWTLKSDKRQKSYHSTDSRPLFRVPGGKYTIEVVHHSTPYAFECICLERNTHTDLVVLLNVSSPTDYDPDEEYFINSGEMTNISEYERRKMERHGQRKYGIASGPLHEFDATMQHSGELKSTMKSLKAHPLLSTATQFDGMPDLLRHDNPASNEEGLAKTIQLILQKHLEDQPGPNPGPRPY